MANSLDQDIWTLEDNLTWYHGNHTFTFGTHIGHSKHPLLITQEMTTHGHDHMVNTEIKLIIFFAAKGGEALYRQQKQDLELKWLQS